MTKATYFALARPVAATNIEDAAGRALSAVSRLRSAWRFRGGSKAAKSLAPKDGIPTLFTPMALAGPG
jgi:hypothetical protein